jgi:hypothetical protein
MKPLFALTALGLFAAVPVLAAPTAPGTGLGIVPRQKFPPRLPMPKLHLIDGTGKLTPAAYKGLSGWKTGHLPRWQIQLGKDTYYLVFSGKNAELEKLAEKLSGSWVNIGGLVERRSFGLGRKPWRPGEPVFQDLKLVSLNVLIVYTLEAAPLKSILFGEPVRVTVQAKVEWFGNAYRREKNGVISGTCKLCAWEGCYIVLNGRTVRVAGLPGDDVIAQQGYRGQTLVLVGRLEQRPGGGLVTPHFGRIPPDVLIVDSFRKA